MEGEGGLPYAELMTARSAMKFREGAEAGRAEGEKGDGGRERDWQLVVMRFRVVSGVPPCASRRHCRVTARCTYGHHAVEYAIYVCSIKLGWRGPLNPERASRGNPWGVYEGRETLRLPKFCLDIPIYYTIAIG